MYNFTLHLNILVLAIILYLVIEATCERCTSTDTRNVYTRCDLDYHKMALWCDYTSFSGLPDPEEIQSQAPCNRAYALYMNSSCLTNLDSNVLKKYISLKEADFSDNLLTNISNNTFVETKKLTTLDLSKNQIRRIDENSFVDIENLKSLKLDQNKLLKLEDGVFRNMVNLRNLNLSNNRIERASSKWFSHETKLESLCVSGNNITSAMEPTLGQFDHLSFLEMGRNKITSLTGKNFRYIPALKEVYLRDNQISSVSNDTFGVSAQLEIIDLQNNNLKTLPKTFVSSLCKLRLLNLKGNNLVLIEVDWFVNVVRHNLNQPTTSESMVGGNKWKCDCKMARFFDFIKSNPVEVAKMLDVVCYHPLEYNNLHLTQLRRDHLVSRRGCLEDLDVNMTLAEDSKATSGESVVCSNEPHANKNLVMFAASNNPEYTTAMLPEVSTLNMNHSRKVEMIFVIVLGAIAICILILSFFIAIFLRSRISKKNEEKIGRNRLLSNNSRGEDIYKV